MLVRTRTVRVGVIVGVRRSSVRVGEGVTEIVVVPEGVDVPVVGDDVPVGLPFAFVAVELAVGVPDFDDGVAVRTGGAAVGGSATSDGIGTIDASGVAV